MGRVNGMFLDRIEDYDEAPPSDHRRPHRRGYGFGGRDHFRVLPRDSGQCYHGGIRVSGRDPVRGRAVGHDRSHRRLCIAAVLCFNYYFLPPIGTFTIADPENWVALAAFSTTSIWLPVGSPPRSSASTARGAGAPRKEMERLYALEPVHSADGSTQPVSSNKLAHQVAASLRVPVLVALFDRATGEFFPRPDGFPRAWRINCARPSLHGHAQ